MSKLEIFLRAILNIGVAAVIAVGTSPWIMALLFLVSAAVTAEVAVRSYVYSAAEKVLLGCGALVTVFILIGLCLNQTPWGLTRGTWAASWLVVSSAVLIWRRSSRTLIRVDDIRLHLGRHWLIGLYGLAALAIFVVAGFIALAGVRSWNQQPLVAFSLVSKSSSRVVVKIDAISTSAVYRIVAQSGSRHARSYSSSPILVSAGGNGQALYENVPVNVSGRWTVDLDTVSSSSPFRQLIVDVSKSGA